MAGKEPRPSEEAVRPEAAAVRLERKIQDVQHAGVEQQVAADAEEAVRLLSRRRQVVPAERPRSDLHDETYDREPRGAAAIGAVRARVMAREQERGGEHRHPQRQREQPQRARRLRRGEPLRVNVSVGGPPALTVAAVMPLPEGLPELAFAGALGGRRVTMVAPDGGLPMPAEADFVIRGTIDPHRRKPEGPFGDHLGYYSLRHDFPVLRVERVYHRDGAIWRSDPQIPAAR